MDRKAAYSKLPSPTAPRVAGTPEETAWRSLISQVTWMVCRKFQFQVFNYVDKDDKGTLDPAKAQRITGATAFLVSDHLAQLIITDGMSREECANPAIGFGNALWRLHFTIFSPYEDWAKHERFAPFSYLQCRSHKTDSPVAILGGLLDLCTYFCLWTEASSLRHMPESLWFFFWTMQQSHNFEQLQRCMTEKGAKLWELAFHGQRPLAEFTARRFALRYEYNAHFLEYWHLHGSKPRNILDDEVPDPTLDELMLGLSKWNGNSVLGRRVKHVDWNKLVGRGGFGARLSEQDRALVCDLVLFGDGGTFMDRIITPVFRALAYEVSTKGGGGVEPAMRITYDDANESFVLPANVYRIIQDLVGKTRNDRRSPDIFYKLWVLGDRSGNEWNVDEAKSWYTGGGKDDLSGNKPTQPWLLKTFQERRTWFATYLAYFRIIAFHVLWFHALLALSFLYDDSEVTLCREDDLDRKDWVICTEAQLDPSLPGVCRNNRNQICADNNRVTEYRPFDASAYKDGGGFDDDDANPWNKLWMGLSTVVITHAVLQLIYAYAVLYTRLKVKPPPAGRADMRKQVTKNQSKMGAFFSLLCCCLPRSLAKLGGLEDERGLTTHENSQAGGNALWQVTHANKVSNAIGGAGRAFMNFCMWILITVGLIFLFLSQFSFLQTTAIEVSEGQLLSGLWGWVSAGYALCILIVWVITMRDGYTVTLGSVFGFFSRCYGSVAGTGSRNSLGSEYMDTQEPKVGAYQFLRNIMFWTFVICIKFFVDFWLIMRQLPKPIRGLRGQEWLSTCGTDEGDAFPRIGSSNIPCVENLLLIGALCFPVFLVVQFDTGIFYQVAVFFYGCLNGLLVLGLGQVVTWNDLVKQFEKGVDQFNRKLLSKQAEDTWKDGAKVMGYYEAAMKGQQDAQKVAIPDLRVLNDGRREEYAKWTPFADVWDSIVLDLRLSDFISDAEERNLRFSSFHFLHRHDMKPHVLPVCFFAGKIQRALDEGSTDGASGVVLQQAYQLFLALLTEIGVLRDFDQQALRSIEFVNQPQNYYHNNVRKRMVNNIKEIISKLSEFKPGTSAKVRENGAKLASTVQALIQDVLIELKYSAKLIPSQASRITAQATILNDLLEARQPNSGFIQRAPGSGVVKLTLNERSRLGEYLNKMCADDSQDTNLPVDEIRDMLKVLQKAMSLTDQEAEPKNEEASRVLKFFMATLLNGSMKKPQSLDRMRSLTTLVPHYAEGVIYPLDADEVQERIGIDVKKGDMGDELVSMMKGLDVSTIDFLRIQFKDEWDNFVERMIVRHGVAKVMQDKGIAKEDITERHFLKSTGSIFSANPEARMDLMIWASERGQMLSRTVKGMMMYGQALKQLEFLETIDSRNGMLNEMVEAKFRHIVASQVYGEKVQSKKPADKWLAKSIEFLMQSYPAMRIAYIDNVDKDSSGKGTPMSVLLKWDPGATMDEPGQVVEVYRVRLPTQKEDKRGVVLGEGKPENQNGAMIFCFGECIQTVDMNQENHMAEAYKMRNLLQEFSQKPHIEEQSRLSGNIDVETCRNAVRIAASKEPITALVGFREWIFSGKAGMLGQFAAGAEFAFGTIVQRTMAEPGGARFHYGHPDVWNKLFTMTRGGVSKATRAFHISEDVFGGYNAIFRGAVIKYKEYISVGKARDVGFAQINGFEAKVSGGNGEQSISRDVNRLGAKLDWFRLMSWYHSGIGFFINSTLTMASVYIAIWLVFFFSLTDSLNVKSGEVSDLERTEAGLTSTLSTVQLFQLGLLSIIPFWGELCLETGFLEGTMNILRQTISGALLFFIFRQQTSAHYFTQIVYYGGAKYIATGRGFDLKHTSYVKQFEAFGRSHIYFGFQLAVLAIMLAIVGVDNYAMSTWGAWLVATALIISPFWFNPATFRTDVVQRDFMAWRNWLAGSRDPDTKESWTTFHRAQMEKARNVEGKQTDHAWNRLAGIGMQTFNVVILVAVFYRLLKTEEDAEEGTAWRRNVGFILFEGVLLAALLMVTVANMVKAKGANIRRYVSIAVFGLVAGVVGYYIWAFDVQNDKTGGFSDFALLAFANMTLMTIAVQVCLYVFPYDRWAMQIVDFGYYAADTAIGLVLFGVLSLLSVVQLVDSLQALLLFSSELLIESRRGAQVRLFDQKFGDVRVSGGAPPPDDAPSTSPAPAAEPHPVPAKESKPGHSPAPGPQPSRPQASVAPEPASPNPWRRTHGARYGTVGAQMTISDSQPLRRSLWERRRIGDGMDDSPQGLLNGPPRYTPE